jgi:5,10-methylenetetrahydromethanopterin reductase
MRLGYAASADAAAPLAVASAQAAEEAGFHEVWLPEDYCERGVFAVAGAVAALTDRIQIGIGVINPWTRHPVLTAMEAAGLDELAEGRLVLGMGASNERWMTTWLGIPFDQPITRTRESVEAIRDLLAGKTVHREVNGYPVNTALSFQAQRPDVPIYLGAKGRRALAVAGQCADGVLLSVMSSPGYIAWAHQQLQAPRKPVSVYVVFACGDDGDAVRQRVRPTVAKYLGIHGDHDITRVAGLEPELCQEFRNRMLRGEPAVDLVTDEVLDTFAIAGTPDQCVEGLARFHAGGADTLVLVGDPEATPQETVAVGRLAQQSGLLSP